MNYRLAHTIGLVTLLVLFGEPAVASSPATSPQDPAPTDQQTGETDRDEQQEETDPAAQDDDTEILLTDEGDIIYTEIDVTGTVIRETPIDSPNSVSIINRESLSQQGSPSVVELFKNMSVSGGVLGESNSWYNGTSTGVAETVANVNLRSLGASRTLVLLNGRRQTYLPARLAGGRFVDVNAFPNIAIDRIDVLKEGAGAVYGSDAIAGVVNFITRSQFEGFEVSASYDHFSGSKDGMLGGIWGRKFGSSAHVVVAMEHKRTGHFGAEETGWSLRPYPGWWWGWSGTGNPGAFIVPQTGATGISALVEAPRFIDPGCDAMGGYTDNGSRTCRFRYQPWDSLIYAQQHSRGFAEINGTFGDNKNYRLEMLYADARIPDWETTPSFPPVSIFDGLQVIGADHPGRRAFVSHYPTLPSSAGEPLDLTGGEPWYFFGRLVGNSGPGRSSPRQSRTRRLGGSVGSEIGETGLFYDLGANYSDARGELSHPAEWAHRKFLAYRGFGGPNCGVDVVVDTAAPSGMALGPVPEGIGPGRGDCSYYNPFSNAIGFSAQPGAQFRNTQNPEFRPELANSPELLGWINEDVTFVNRASLLTTDATLNGTLHSSFASYAVGYQYRLVDVGTTPNAAGNLDINPCPVPGDTGCPVQTGSFTFTSGAHPYDDRQGTHVTFVELALKLGERVDAQVAAHYERYEFADSFDPKTSIRVQLSNLVALRGTVQTSFRTPSVDDLNQDLVTTTDYVAASGTWKAISTSGSTSLLPEDALTYNVGVIVKRDPDFDFTLDYWGFDFNNPIGVLPHAALASAYADPFTRSAVQDRIFCPGNRNDGSCDPVDIERIRVHHINWPGIKTSGIDWHLGGRRLMGPGVLVGRLDGNHTLDFEVEALLHNGVELRPREQAAGYLNRTNPLAPPLPRWRTHGSLGYHWRHYGLIGGVHYISGYEDRDTVAAYSRIDKFLTFDLNFRWQIPDSGTTVTVSGLNLADQRPPLVNTELAFDSLTHNPRGRRVKLTVTQRF